MINHIHLSSTEEEIQFVKENVINSHGLKPMCTRYEWFKLRGLNNLYEKIFTDETKTTAELFHRFLNEVNIEIKCKKCNSKNACFRGFKEGYSDYCCDCVWSSSERESKRHKTLFKNHGYISPFELKETIEKMNETNKMKYGVKFPLQSKEIRQKTLDTMGVKKTPFELNSTKLKKDKTLMFKYGTIHAGKIHASMELSSKEEFLKFSKGKSLTTMFNYFSRTAIYSTIKKFDLQENYNINDRSISSGEQELYNYIRSIVPDHIEILQSDRTVLKPKELDIYIPELKLAFEFNGDYWHSNKPRGYHEQKTSDCLSQGIHLIHIWEHDWIEDNVTMKQQIIKMINN